MAILGVGPGVPHPRNFFGKIFTIFHIFHIILTIRDRKKVGGRPPGLPGALRATDERLRFTPSVRGVLYTTPSLCQNCTFRFFRGPFRKIFGRNISAKVQPTVMPLTALTQAVTLYRPIPTVAQYYFRFRQGALSTFFSFSRLTPKRGYELCRVVPRWKGHVTPYKMPQRNGGYLSGLGGQGPPSRKSLRATLRFFVVELIQLTLAHARQPRAASAWEFWRKFISGISRNRGLKFLGWGSFFEFAHLQRHLAENFYAIY